MITCKRLEQSEALICLGKRPQSMSSRSEGQETGDVGVQVLEMSERNTPADLSRQLDVLGEAKGRCKKLKKTCREDRQKGWEKLVIRKKV